MGKRGPKPTPTALLKLRGSWRAGTRDGEPEATPEGVPCPAWLGDRAREHWDEIHPMLVGWGVMARPFEVGLAVLVDAIADWVALAKELEQVEVWTNPLARPVVMKQKSEARKQVLAALREFGMTPSAVTAVRKVEKKDASPLDRFKRTA